MENSNHNLNKLEIVLHGKDGSSKQSDGKVGSSTAKIGSFTNPKSKGWRTLFSSANPITPQPPMKFTPPSGLNGMRVVDYSAGDLSAGIKRCEEYVVGLC
ncbi:hypothetical protein MKW98_025698, partial [Papaver atlanticum]